MKSRKLHKALQIKARDLEPVAECSDSLSKARLTPRAARRLSAGIFERRTDSQCNLRRICHGSIEALHGQSGNPGERPRAFIEIAAAARDIPRRRSSASCIGCDPTTRCLGRGVQRAIGPRLRQSSRDDQSRDRISRPDRADRRVDPRQAGRYSSGAASARHRPAHLARSEER